MKRELRSFGSCRACVCILLLLLAAASAVAQTGTSRKIVDQSKFQKLPFTPRPFQPLTSVDKDGKIKDLLTNKTFQPGDSITVPAVSRRLSIKGRGIDVKAPAQKFNAKEYYDQVNGIEKYLNSKGHSLKEKKDFGSVEKFDARYTKLAADKQKAKAVEMFNPIPLTLNFDRYKPHEGVTAAQYVEYKGSRSFNQEFGDPSVMCAWWRNSFDCTKNIDPRALYTAFHAESSVGQTMLGWECTLTRVTVDAEMGNDNKGTLKPQMEINALPPLNALVPVWVAGDRSGTGPVWEIPQEEHGLFNQTFFEMWFYIQAGPVPISITIGASGDATLSIKGRLSNDDNTSSYLTVDPHTSSSAFSAGQVGVKLIVAVGIGISLEMISIHTPITQTLSVTPNTDPCKRTVVSNFKLDVTLNALDGYVYLAFTILLCDFNIELFDWEGVQLASLTLMDETESLVPCNRDCDPALGGITYFPQNGGLAVDVVNWGGPPAEGWNGFTLTVSNTTAGTSCAVPFTTINHGGELDRTTEQKEGRVRYNLDIAELKTLKMPLSGRVALTALMTPRTQEKKYNRFINNDKASLAVNRACNIAVTGLTYKEGKPVRGTARRFLILKMESTGKDHAGLADLKLYFGAITLTVEGRSYSFDGQGLLPDKPVIVGGVEGFLSAIALPMEGITFSGVSGQVKIRVDVVFPDAQSSDNSGEFTVALPPSKGGKTTTDSTDKTSDSGTAPPSKLKPLTPVTPGRKKGI